MASKLGVDEVSLRMSVDSLAPYPTLDVLSAVVTAYGVDPTWLITGDYNSGTHRALETEPQRALEGMREMIRALQTQPLHNPPAEPPTLRLLRDA